MATPTYTPKATRYLSVPGGRIAYDVAGDGPLVLLVPGMGDLRGTYRFLVPALVAAGYRVASTDLRGHGDSDAGFASYGDEETAGDIAALIEELVSDLVGRDEITAGQMDMFRPGAERDARARDEGGQDWVGIVQAMCRSSTQPERSIRQYMRDTADRIRALTGISIPDNDPEAFLKASASAGVLYIAD